MRPSVKRSPTSDDEEDLESLRLAALQSLKRPATTGIVSGSTHLQMAPKSYNSKMFGGVKGLHKRGRGFHQGGRIARNGPFNRVRNSNLISVPTVGSNQTQDSLPDANRAKKFADESIPKLILPQDRYCNTKISLDKVSEVSSKFDRYNDSDKSDSDSESEDEKTSDIESPRKLERTNSLEALMLELENEIQGEAKEKPKSKVKKPKKLKTVEVVIESSDDVEIKPKPEPEKLNEATQDEPESQEPQKVEIHSKDNVIKAKSPVRPLNRRPPTENCVHISQPLYVNSLVPVTMPVMPFQPAPYPNFVPLPMPYPFAAGPPSPSHQIFSPSRYERPISPLTIKTNILNTISAPLSPRSAAFVLQNREIIERRKKSPRRSYSRSPSPEFRRSLSPRYRRSSSPIRQRHSPNRRASPSRRTSPTRSSPSLRRLSPGVRPSSRRASPTGNRYKLSPSGGRNLQKSNVRNRLGGQTVAPSKPPADNSERKIRKRSRSISLSLSPSPERFDHVKTSPKDNDDQMNNPVLEARRRKFEAGAVPTEGIIRLRPKEEEEEVTEKANGGEGQPKSDGELSEDEPLVGDDSYIEFTVKVDDLFSDEESDTENEGRFKSNRQQTQRSVPVVPYTQLLNGPLKTVENPKDKRSHERTRERRDRTRPARSDRDRKRTTPERSRHKEERDREKSKIRQRSRSPLRSDPVIECKHLNKNAENVKKELAALEKRVLKSSKVDSKLDRRKPLLVSPIENKKIEIKIRNPSKYEVANKDDEPAKDRKVNARKVEVTSNPVVDPPVDEDFDESEPEIEIDVEECDDEDVVTKNEDAGDLRAQLSRKRAERQNKLPKVEGVPSRLLQNALQGAVFKKSKKAKSKKKEKEAAPLDGVDASVCAAAIRRTTTKTGYGDGADINHSTGRRVRVLYCDAEPLPAASDGKLPIHLRLGIPGSMDIFTDPKPHKISRKRSKNRGNFDQV